jgi:hypothetical protein
VGLDSGATQIYNVPITIPLKLFAEGLNRIPSKQRYTVEGMIIPCCCCAVEAKDKEAARKAAVKNSHCGRAKNGE